MSLLLGSQIIIDPFTRIFQAAMNAIINYPPLTPKSAGGLGAFRTFQDVSSPNFQDVIQNYQAGDTPSLLIWQRRLNFNPFGPGTNSKTVAFTMDCVICITTDTLQVMTMNQIVFLLVLAFANQPADLGLPGIVQQWTFQGGDATVVNPVDSGAGGAMRWSYATTLNIKGYLQVETLIGIEPFVQ